MSLISYLNFDSSSSSSSSSSTNSLGSAYSTALAQLQAAQAKLASTSTSTSGSGVTISTTATIAAATKEDASKDAATLITDVRADLDAQYTKNGKGKIDLSEMSPRAVAAIALNSTGKFSKAEMLTAKQEMRSRDRASFFQVTANDFSVSSLEAYQNAKLVSYKSMSAEERAVRGTKG